MHHLNNNIKIVYEDDRLIVIDKPSGLLTMASDRSDPVQVTAYSILTDYIRQRNPSRRHSIFIVHRLDRDTSGVIVFAKDPETKYALQENWHEIVLERKYIAILEGHIDDDDGWIESWQVCDPKSLKVYCHEILKGESVSNPPEEGWKFTSSHCKVLNRYTIDGKPYTKVEFELETGRKNQIRAHSEWIGHPIAGDGKYGAHTNPFCRLALHARSLSFIHPESGKVMTFNSPLPKALRKSDKHQVPWQQ